MKNVYGKIKKYGLSGLLEFLTHKIIKTYWVDIHYLKTNINYKQISNKLKNLDLKVQKLDYDDFLLGDPNEFSEQKLRIIKRRLNSDFYHCYGLVENDKLIYSTWISLKKIGLPIVDGITDLLGNEGFLEDSYCHPSHRGKGLHSKFNLYRMAKIYELGKKNCLVFVFKGNIAALKVQLRAGFTDLGIFSVGKIFGFNFTTLNKKKFDKLFESINKNHHHFKNQNN